MKKLILAVVLSISALHAQAVRVEDGMLAGCKLHDAWTGPDKTKHILVGGAIGAAITAATKEPLYGLGATIVVAGAKEVWDRRGHGTCSYQDFAVTVAAGAAASYGVNWLVVPRKNGVTVAYNMRF